MSKGLSSKNIIVSENNQCNCFGYTQKSQHYFLSKHKSLEIKNNSSNHHLLLQEESPLSLKNIGKRSLRKNISPARQPPITSRTNDHFQDYYSNNVIEIVQSKKQTKPNQSQSLRYYSPIRSERDPPIQQRKPIEAGLVRNNNLKTGSWQPILQPQHFYVPVQPALSSPRIMINQNNQPGPIRISFNHSPPAMKYSPQASPRQTVKNEKECQNKKVGLRDYKQQVKISIKQMNQLPQDKGGNDQIIEFQLTEDNIDSPRYMAVEKKNQLRRHDLETLKLPNDFENNDYFKFGETFQSKIQKPKSNNKKEATFKSKIETNKSRISADPKRSTIGNLGKSKIKSLREDKKSLRKMDDVQEIRSMIDSDQLSQDKQSVVLGRLNEYGSMLDPSLSLTTPTLRSKLVSMNTQSSTIGKSFLKPFEFNMERTHFK